MAETKKLKVADAPTNYHIVLIGVGGTGGYIMRSLVRMMHSFQLTQQCRFHLTICDGDSVEEKNLLRQDFIQPDVHKKKVDVLAHRFQHAYGISISKRDTYVEDIESLRELCRTPKVFEEVIDGDSEYEEGVDYKLVLIGSVDNNATRQLLHQYFTQENPYSEVIYVDAGNESMKDSDQLYAELTPEEQQELDSSGYSGQVVIGWKKYGKLILPPVCQVYPDMLEDKETFFPSQSCGREVVNHPQRRMTNEVSAMVVTSYLNSLFSLQEIVSHVTTFNAQTMTIKPRLFTEDYVEYLKEEFGAELDWPEDHEDSQDETEYDDEEYLEENLGEDDLDD